MLQIIPNTTLQTKTRSIPYLLDGNRYEVFVKLRDLPQNTMLVDSQYRIPTAIRLTDAQMDAIEDYLIKVRIDDPTLDEEGNPIGEHVVWKDQTPVGATILEEVEVYHSFAGGDPEQDEAGNWREIMPDAVLDFIKNSNLPQVIAFKEKVMADGIVTRAEVKQALIWMVNNTGLKASRAKAIYRRIRT